MTSRLRILLTAAFVSAGLLGRVYAATVTLDGTREYQTIDGFGAHGAMDVWWSDGPFYSDQFLDWILDDLGMTIFRNEYYPDETKEAMGYGAGQWQKQLPFLKAVKGAADRKGIEVKFMATLWSPPGGMKYNQITKGKDAMWNRVSNGLGPYNDFQNPDYHEEKGGKPNMYPKLVEYCIEAVERYKRDAGIDLYCFSVANEPRFAQGFNSCVWSPGQYRDITAMLGKAFEQKGITTKLIGAEDMASTTFNYMKAVFNDDVTHAGDHLDILACHGYSNGVDPYLPNSLTKALASMSKRYGKPIWMTETSGYHERWEDHGAFDLGVTIASALFHGNFSGWVWWQLGGGTTLNEYDLMTRSGGGTRYHVSKQFYKYIRPGAVRIESQSDDQELVAAAFNHKNNKTLTVVMINAGQGSKTVSLEGTNVPSQFTVYRSSAGERCKNVGTMGKGSISLPKRSITTLVATGYEQEGRSTVSIARRGAAPRIGNRGAVAGRQRVFALDGSLAGWKGRGGFSRGAYVAVGPDGATWRLRVVPQR